MFAKNMNSLVYLPMGEVAVSKLIDTDVLQDVAMLFRGASGVVASEAVNLFLHLHPIFCMKTRSDYLCIAGLRSLALARQNLGPKDKMPCFLAKIPNRDRDRLGELNRADLLLSSLIFGVENQCWAIDIARIWDGFDGATREQLFPGITTKLELAALLDIDRRRLSSSRSTPTSRLREEMGERDEGASE